MYKLKNALAPIRAIEDTAGCGEFRDFSCYKKLNLVPLHRKM